MTEPAHHDSHRLPAHRGEVNEGGDPACWLERVCPGCDAVLEHGESHDCPGGTRDDGPTAGAGS